MSKAISLLKPRYIPRGRGCEGIVPVEFPLEQLGIREEALPPGGVVLEFFAPCSVGSQEGLNDYPRVCGHNVSYGV